MNIEDIFKMEHSYYSTLIPLKDLENKEYETLIESCGLDINDIYKVEGKLYPYCYSKGTVLVEIYQMDKFYFENFKVLEHIKQRTEAHSECINTSNYNRLFGLIDKPYRFYWYEKLFYNIPDDQKYEVFKYIYISSEYGFSDLSREFLEQVFKYKQPSEKWFQEDIITIYRGEGSMSTPYYEAYSWTTSKKVARRFANRFDSNEQVIKAKVKQSDILDYFSDRNECEVIVYPENVFDAEILD